MHASWKGSTSQKGVALLSTEENKAIVRRLIEEGFNQKNWAIFEELYAPDVVVHNSSLMLRGREAITQFLAMFFTAFPDARFTIEDLIAEGNTFVFRHTLRGIHQGDYLGIPPTGKQVTVPGISIFRIANGKVSEQWTNADDLGGMRQLGVFPPMG